MDLTITHISIAGASVDEVERLVLKLTKDQLNEVIDEQPATVSAASTEPGATPLLSQFHRKFFAAIYELGGEATSIEIAKKFGVSLQEFRSMLAGAGNSKVRIKGVFYNSRYDKARKLNIYFLTRFGTGAAIKYLKDMDSSDVLKNGEDASDAPEAPTADANP